MTYQVEDYPDLLPDLKILLPLHWQEIALDQDTIPLSPRWDAYQYLHDYNRLLCVTVRHLGQLVGYQLCFIDYHMHYAESLTAQSDVFWLHPDYRRGRTGLRLFQTVEAALRERGVQKFYSGCKTHFDLSRLFDYLGYRKTEIIYTKLL